MLVMCHMPIQMPNRAQWTLQLDSRMYTTEAKRRFAQTHFEMSCYSGTRQ